jgi:hypothetical protein
MWGMLLGAQLSQHNINLSHTGVMVASNELGFLAYHSGRVNQNVYFPRQFSNLLNPSEAALSEEPKPRRQDQQNQTDASVERAVGPSSNFQRGRYDHL